MADSMPSELDQLRRENARLTWLLKAHGIAWCTAAGPMMLYRQLDSAMQVVSFSEARESFKAVLDRVEADADVTLITRRHAQGAVVMSLDTYNSLMETVHLLRSPANAAHLQRSLEQAERGELLSHPLLDADS
jgi:antitoxin YefM